MTDLQSLIERVEAALDAYLAEQDEYDWCQRVKHGKCQTRKCLINSTEKIRTPVNFDAASCPRWRLEQALACLRARQHEGKAG